MATGVPLARYLSGFKEASMSDKHEQARELGEEALEALDEGDEKKADALIEKAKELDETALTELVEELDEGAGKTPPE